MAYTFSSISKTGVRPVGFDCTPFLKSTEVLSSATVVSTDTSLVTISVAAAVNVATFVNDNGDTVAIGKGVEWTFTVQKVITKTVRVLLAYVGDGASADTIELDLPIVPEKQD